MKQRIQLTLLIIFIISLFPLTVQAAESSNDLSGTSSFVSWVLCEDGTLTLNGILSEPEALCVAAVYDNDGCMMAVKSSSLPAPGESSTLILLERERPANFHFKLFFIDQIGTPLGEAAEWRINLAEPTCTKAGYTFVSGPDGSRKCAPTDPLGHSWGEETVAREPEGVVPGELSRTCTRCGAVGTEPIYPETNLPILRLYGSLMGIEKTVDVPLTSVFTSGAAIYDNHVTLKYQGHTSLIYPKKNYTIKFYKDAEHQEKAKFEFYDWGKEYKYILKANYVDPAKCRNLLCADLWSEVCMSRDGTKHIKKLFNYGAVDGMPVGVYLNDSFIGLYDLTLHKDDDLYDLDKGQLDALMIINQCTSDEALFRGTSEFSRSSDWELEFCGTEDTAWAKDKLNAFINFVLTASDEEFANKANLKPHVNIDSAIDYLLTMYTLGLTNSYAKNLVLLSYSDDPWIMSMFDMENAFGIRPDGLGFLDPSYCLPSCTEGHWSSGTDSLFWDRMLQCYESRIRARYAQLREKLFTVPYIESKLTALTGRIPEEFYAADRALYPEMLSEEEDYIITYLSKRLDLLDAIFLNGSGE